MWKFVLFGPLFSVNLRMRCPLFDLFKLWGVALNGKRQTTTGWGAIEVNLRLLSYQIFGAVLLDSGWCQQECQNSWPKSSTITRAYRNWRKNITTFQVKTSNMSKSNFGYSNCLGQNRSGASTGVRVAVRIRPLVAREAGVLSSSQENEESKAKKKHWISLDSYKK